MRISLKNFTTPDIPLASLLVVICVLLWFLSPADGHATFPVLQSPTVFSIDSLLNPGSLVSSVLSFILVVFNAFLMVQMNNRFTIIRTRTFLPFFVFLLLTATWSKVHTVGSSQLILSLVVLSLFNFFSMSRDRKASEPAFLGSFLLSIASFFANPLVLLIPLCWIGFMIFQSFSLRTFLASIFGALAPWVVLLSVYYALNGGLELSAVFSLQPDLQFSFLQTDSLHTMAYTILFAAFYGIGVIGMYLLSHSDAIHTRNKLNFLVLFSLSLLVIGLVFQSQAGLFLPLLAFVFSLLFSHPFTLKQNNFNSIVFLLFLLLQLGYYVINFVLYS